jgi:hypothetical protein
LPSGFFHIQKVSIHLKNKLRTIKKCPTEDKKWIILNKQCLTKQ